MCYNATRVGRAVATCNLHNKLSEFQPFGFRDMRMNRHKNIHTHHKVIPGSVHNALPVVCHVLTKKNFGAEKFVIFVTPN